MLSIHTGSGNGTPQANGEAPRKPANPNRLYISGLPYSWRTQHVSEIIGVCACITHLNMLTEFRNQAKAA